MACSAVGNHGLLPRAALEIANQTALMTDPEIPARSTNRRASAERPWPIAFEAALTWATIPDASARAKVSWLEFVSATPQRRRAHNAAHATVRSSVAMTPSSAKPEAVEGAQQRRALNILIGGAA